MSICALIVARLSSSRLPQKNIKPILGIPMIQLLADRVSKAKCVDKVIFTTSIEASDDPLQELAKKTGHGCYRGSLDNVMERIVGAAKEYRCDTVIEILGDNPLVHADLIDDTFEIYKNGHYDYAATITEEYEGLSEGMAKFAVGLRVQIYNFQAAMDYKKFPEYPDNGKHPCAYIFDHPHQYKLGFLQATGKWSFLNKPKINFAVNYPKNFDLVRKIFEGNFPADHNFSLASVIRQMDKDRSLYDLTGAE